MAGQEELSAATRFLDDADKLLDFFSELPTGDLEESETKAEEGDCPRTLPRWPSSSRKRWPRPRLEPEEMATEKEDLEELSENEAVTEDPYMGVAQEDPPTPPWRKRRDELLEREWCEDQRLFAKDGRRLHHPPPTDGRPFWRGAPLRKSGKYAPRGGKAVRAKKKAKETAEAERALRRRAWELAHPSAEQQARNQAEWEAVHPTAYSSRATAI